MSNVRSLLLFLSAITGTMALHIDNEKFPRHGEIVICGEKHVDLNWTYQLQIYETLIGLKWTFKSSKVANKTLATMDSEGNFQAVDQRVTFLGGNGIRISNLTADDDGLVRGEIKFNFSGIFLTKESVANVTSRLFVFVPPTVTFGELIIKTDTAATKDLTSGKWYLTLRCGPFSFKGHPQLPPLIRAPSGRRLKVVDGDEYTYITRLYEDDVEDGKYECAMPFLKKCKFQQMIPAYTIIGRSRVKHFIVNGHLKILDERITKAINNTDSAYPKIGCTAQLHKTAKQYQAGEALIFSSAHCNHGEAYDAATGKFTAPVGGEYIVHATAMTMNKKPCYLSIMHGDKVISTGIATYKDKAYYAAAVAHAIIHLHEGETLWVSNHDPNTLWMEGSFSVGILQTSTKME